jgi:hypothetical protein
VSRAEVESRLQDIYGLVVDGAPFRTIRQFVSEKCAWSVDERTLRRYVKRCTDSFVKEAEMDREKLRANAALRLNRVYAMQIQRNDLRGAVITQGAIARLHGLDAPTRQELTGAGGEPLHGGLTDEELAQMTRDLVEAQAERLGTDAPD